MATVKETVESGITPITLGFADVHFFNTDECVVRTALIVNSLDLGVLEYAQYRFVARRTKVGNQLVRRHLEKLFRRIPELLMARPEIKCFTVPVYARLLSDSELAAMLVDMISLYPEVPPSKICVELSADLLYEDLGAAAEKIDELRALGVSVAISEVGDQFCPVFRLSEIKFDYAFMDSYSTAYLGGAEQDRVAGSLVKYLHYLDVKVIAPGLETEAAIKGAAEVGADGYTTDKINGDVGYEDAAEAEENVENDADTEAEAAEDGAQNEADAESEATEEGVESEADAEAEATEDGAQNEADAEAEATEEGVESEADAEAEATEEGVESEADAEAEAAEDGAQNETDAEAPITENSAGGVSDEQ